MELNISTVTNCDSAYLKIKEATKQNPIDIIFLDIKLPPSKDRKILSGEDLGVKIRKQLPKTKVVVATTYNDNYRISTLFKNIDPDGSLLKNDLDPKELVMAIETITKDAPYYSKTILQLMRKKAVSDLQFDDLERHLLY